MLFVLLLVIVATLAVVLPSLYVARRIARINNAFNVPVILISLQRHWNRRGMVTLNRLRRIGHRNIHILHGTDAFSDNTAAHTFNRLRLTKRHGIMHTEGERGCAASHLRVYERMIHYGIRRAMVYEDDALPCDSYRTILPSIISAAKSYDICLIGHMLKKPSQNTLVSPDGSYAMHAYLISLQGSKKILHDALKYGWHEPIDMTIGKHHRRMSLSRSVANHLVNPPLFGGKPRPNVRSCGFVAQDHDLGTSIQSKHIRNWT